MLAAALAVLVGLLAVAAWALRLGFVADLLSQPILVGYLAGVAVIMIVGQLGKVTGVPVSGDTLIAELESFVRGLGPDPDRAPLALALASLAFLFLVEWRFPRLPGPLLAVLLATAAVTVFDLQRARDRGRRPGSRRPADAAAARRSGDYAGAAAAGGRRPASSATPTTC